MRQEIKATAKEQIRGNMGVLIVIQLIVMAITTVASIVLPILGAVVAPVLNLSVIAVYLNLWGGVKPQVGDCFCRINSFGKALWLNILVGFFTYLWSLLFVIPGIIKSFSYMLSFYILAENPEISAGEALNLSKEMMKGHKMEAFMLGLSFMGWMLLGIFTCGIALFYVIPYMQATYAGFYNYVKECIPVER